MKGRTFHALTERQYRSDGSPPQINLQMQCIFYQNPRSLFCTNWQANSKFIWKCKGFRTAKIILKTSEVGGLILPHFKMYYKAAIINLVYYWHKDRHRQDRFDKWNRIKSPEISPCIYSQLTFNKSTKKMQWERNNLFKKWDNWKSI